MNQTPNERIIQILGKHKHILNDKCIPYKESQECPDNNDNTFWSMNKATWEKQINNRSNETNFDNDIPKTLTQ